MVRETPPHEYDDNPEWTEEDFLRARPAAEILLPEVVAAFARRSATLIETATIEITLRLDADVIERFRASGPGWQARMNEALRRAAP